MQFIAENWQLVFGGLGTAVVAAIVGAWAKAYFDRQKAAKAKPAVSKADGGKRIDQCSNRRQR